MKSLTEDMDVNGIFIVEVIRDGKHGPEVIDRRVAPNLIVNTGKRQIWRRASGLSANNFNFMRIGTSALAAVSAHTNVRSPVPSPGSLLAVDSKTLLSGTRTMQWVRSYASGAGTITVNGIVEVCIMNSLTTPGGSALNRSVFTSVNKTLADKLRITYQARIT